MNWKNCLVRQRKEDKYDDKFGFVGMMEMEIEIGKLIKKAKLIRCGDGEYPVLSMTMHDGLMFQNDRFKKQIASIDQSQYQIVHRHQLVESFPIDEGVLAVQELTDIGIVSPAYKIWDVDMEKVVPKYLEFALRAPRSIEYYKSKLRGTTARRRSIPDTEFCAMRIKCPSLNEQKIIVDTIEKTKQVIKLRSLELDTLDDLIKARFIELFGDPLANTKGWNTECLFNVAPIKQIPFGYNEKIWLLNLDAIESNTGTILFKNYVNQDEINSSTIVFSTDNVLYSKLRPYLNKVVLPDENGVATSELLPLLPNKEKLNRVYLCYWLRSNSFVKHISEKVAGAKMPRVAMDYFKTINIELPPIDLQNEFAKFAEETDKSKVAIQKSLDEAQLLFDSLMQKYFG